MMNARSIYSYGCAGCAAFTAAVLIASLAGCFSERVAAPPTGEELCSGTLPANTVRISDFQFQPAQLNVSRGTTVTFVNCGPSAHTSTADANNGWDSNLMQQFATFEVTLPNAGSNPYHCEPHPSMKGTITVQ
jgi:plastocyanin